MVGGAPTARGRSGVRACAGECVCVSKCAAGSGKNQRTLLSARDLALGKVKVRRVPDSKHSALFFFSISNGTVLVSGAGLGILPSVHYMTLDNYIVCRVSYS